MASDKMGVSGMESVAVNKFSIGHDRDKKERTEDVIIPGLDSNIDFKTLQISPAILQGLTSCGFRKPSPIELQAIPLGKAGHDLLVQSKSGTGKTCVFTVVSLESVDVTQKCIQVVVVNPARELAIQNAYVMAEIGSCMEGLLVHTFIGGVALSENILNAGDCHVAVGTPGRIVQLLREEYMDLSRASILVLDEADKLTDGSFFEDVRAIVDRMPAKKQVIAVSATYPAGLDEFIVRFMKSPQKVQLDLEKPALIGVSQVLFDVQKVVEDQRRLTRDEEIAVKYKCLLKILKHIQFTQAMIFCQYQMRANQIYEDLCKEDIDAKLLSGRMTQKDRTISYNCLRWGTKKIIVCTDLCSRGLDSELLDVVINFELPSDLATYQHRVGRAGRFGSFGMTINLVANKHEMEKLRNFQNELKVDLLVIDSIETLVGLGQQKERLKELRRLNPSCPISALSGISSDYLKFCLFGSKEEREATQIERLTMFTPTVHRKPQELQDLVNMKLSFIDELIDEIKLKKIERTQRRAARKLKSVETTRNFEVSDSESDSEDTDDDDSSNS